MSGSEMTDEPERRCGPRWLLIASIALNLFLLAAVIGHIATGGFGRDRRDSWRGMSEEVLADASPELRQAAKALRESRRAAFRGAREGAQAAHEATLATLRADEFDRQAFLDAWLARRAAFDEARVAAAEATAEFAAQLDKAQRLRLAEMFDERQKRRAERWRRRSRD